MGRLRCSASQRLTPCSGEGGPRRSRAVTARPRTATPATTTAVSAAVCAAARKGDPAAALGALLDQEDWPQQPAIVAALAPVLPPLAARYLLTEKQHERPLDPVARFHLGNGARLERIHALADTSRRGLTRAAGLMVNYLYPLDEIEENHEAYARDGRVAASHAVRRLVRGT